MENIEESIAPIRRSKETIQGLIMKWQQSRQSKVLFCKENNLNYLTFVSWTNPTKKKKSKLKSSITSGFLPLKIKDIPKVNFAEVQLINGTKICFHESVSAEYLRCLVR